MKLWSDSKTALVSSPYGNGCDTVSLSLANPLVKLRYSGRREARIDEAHFVAGCRYQSAWEKVSGSRNLGQNYERPRIDGGATFQPYDDHVVDAVRRLEDARFEVGDSAYRAIFEPVLGRGETITENARRIATEDRQDLSRARHFVRQTLVRGLDALAARWGCR